MEQDPLKLVNNRVAAGRATGVARSVAQARAADRANRRTEYKGFNAARGQAIIQGLGEEPLIGPQVITNGAISPGANVALNRAGGIPSIDQMPSPRRKKKRVSKTPTIKTQFIVSLRVFDKALKALMTPEDSVYSRPFVVLHGLYSSKSANWELQDARVNALQARGCGFWTGAMESASFAATITTYTGSGSRGYLLFGGGYGPTEYTFTVSGVRDFTTTPPTYTENFQTSPPDWSGNTDSLWTIGEWIYTGAYKQTHPLLSGTATHTQAAVLTFNTSTDTNRFSGLGSAKSFSVFRGKLATLTGRTSEQTSLDALSFVGGSGSNTQTIEEARLVTGQTLLLPGRRRLYSSESVYTSAYVAPNTTITNEQNTDISTCLVVREDLKLTIIYRQNLQESIVNASQHGFFLSSGSAADKKINSGSAMVVEIRSALDVAIPPNQNSTTLSIPAKMPLLNGEDISSFVGQDFIVAVPFGSQFKTGYGKLTGLALGSIVQEGQSSLQYLTLTMAVERTATVDYFAQAVGTPYGAACSSNNSFLQIQGGAGLRVVPTAGEATIDPKRVNFLKDNNIYIAQNITNLNAAEIDSFAEVFSLEETEQVINVVRQELPITGKIKPLVVQSTPDEAPQTFEILDISCNPANTDYPFKVLFAGQDGTYIRLYVGGDKAPVQIGKKILMSKYEIDKAFINNVRSIWTEEE
ncbi:hypothetical protein [Coleofasciculus sp. FACHB-T130]|uniref:hypothetical protein n=1 Tax=Cyanophyceae TaxID=3028117 RepID=UPI0016832A84|nr:hypothetical protein [Coleofasciculus sp. FACHB-T130]MBD1878381.1 hypothetical protein [Coleofasciculus sp. FACHB-T130]